MDRFKKAFATALAAGTMASAPADNVITISKPPRTNGTSANYVYNKVVDDLIQDEGTRQYQASKGFFRNGRFYPYKCSRGYWTIGYGHKILKGEDFSKGITEQQARSILSNDAQSAWKDSISLMREHNVNLTKEQQQLVLQILPNMVFQLGKEGVRKFENMWKALQRNDFATASKEMLDSKWARSDSPNRAKRLASQMRMIYN